MRAAAAGQATFAPEVGERLVRGFAVRDDRSPAALRDRFPALTQREAEILALVALGRSNAEIAGELFLGIATVKSHINALFAKLQVRDRAQAVALALGADQPG